MKKSSIIAIVLIAVVITFFIGSVTQSSSYADFEKAFSKPGKEYHVVGTLDRTALIAYNPEENPNLTAFTMIDNTGQRRKVMLNKSKPQDFERSESVVIIGKAVGEEFYASDILMKCPSKYKEDGKFDMETTSAKDTY
jgi:cytochrome c-type biogenesis protein CcmE